MTNPGYPREIKLIQDKEWRSMLNPCGSQYKSFDFCLFLFYFQELRDLFKVYKDRMESEGKKVNKFLTK